MSKAKKQPAYLTAEQVQQNLISTFNLSEKFKITVTLADTANPVYYVVTTKNGSSIVTPKAVYLRDNEGKSHAEAEYTGVSYEFNGLEYVKHPNKEQAKVLQIACGFKKIKAVDPDKPLELWEQIKAYACDHGRFELYKDSNAKAEVTRINTYVEFAKGLIKDFTYVRMYMVNEVFYFFYYKGRGKTMHEGKASLLTDGLDERFLIPALEAVYGKPIQKEVRKTSFQIEAEYDKQHLQNLQTA